MTTVELRHFWKKLEQLKKRVPGYLHMGDFRNLPEFTVEQKELSSREVKELVYQARDQA